MSVRADPGGIRYRRPSLDRAGGLAIVLLGGLLLIARSRWLVLGSSGRALALAVSYTAILGASLLVPVPAGARRLHPMLVLAMGLASLALAGLVAGRPVAIPFGVWALPLSVIGAVAEEALFRRVAFGALEPAGAAVAVAGTALLFALIHLPLYGIAVFPVDLGAGLLLGWQRWASGTWGVPAATHVTANALAVLLR